MGDYHCLNKLDNVDSIDEAFYGSSCPSEMLDSTDLVMRLY